MADQAQAVLREPDAGMGAWLTFVLEMFALSIIVLYVSRKPEGNEILVMTVAILELIRGMGGELLWMSPG